VRGEVPTNGSSHSRSPAHLSLTNKAADYRRIPNGATRSGVVSARGIRRAHLEGSKVSDWDMRNGVSRVARAQQQSWDRPGQASALSDVCEVDPKQCEVSVGD